MVVITLYWCRKFGQFCDKETGNYATGAEFRGTQMEWYETLIETIFDAMRRSGATRILINNAPLAILSTSVLYVANLDRKNQSDPLGRLHRTIPVSGPGIRARAA